jgi:WD40 repeat protein
MPLLQKQDLGAHGTRITPLLQDTVEILQLYGVPIRSHALHCYHSAFVTMPSCLLLDTLAQQHVPDSLPRLLAPRAAHLGQEARVLYGHLSPVKAVAWSPDDTRIVSCSQGSSIRVWSAITFQALGHLEGHTDWVQSVVFSPDSARIISGSKDCTLRVWSTVAMEHLVTLRGHQKSVASVAVSPDGKRIVSGSWDHTVRVWCTSSFAELGCLSGDGQGILCVAFSTKGDRLISSCRDTVRVFNAFSLECLASLQATIHRVSMSPGLFRDVIFSHDDRHIFTGTSSGTVRIWCAITFRELGVLDQKMGSADWLSVSSNGAFVLSGDKDNGYIHVWNAGDFKEITRFHAHQRGVRSVAFSPDGTRFVSGGMDDTVRAWDTRMFDDNAVPLKSHTSDISSLTFSVDGIHMMSRLPEFGLPATVRVWNVRRFEELGQVECASLFVFSPTSARAVVQQEDMSLSLWNLSPLEKILDLSTLQSTGDRRVESISYSPEGTHIVCGMPRGTIEILNAVNLERLATFEAHSSPVLDVRFSTNGTRLVSRSASDGIRVWRADTLDRMGEIALHQGSVECMAVSPLGTHVVAALHDKTVRVWSTVTFEELTSLEFGSDGYLPATHVAFSPDGRCILARRFSKTRVWTCSQADNCQLALLLLFAIFADVNRVAVWTEVSLSGVQLPTDGNPGVFGVSLSETGWLRCWIHSQPRQIWLPHDRQGKRTWANFASRDEKVAVMSDIGVLTMLTFPVGKK